MAVISAALDSAGETTSAVVVDRGQMFMFSVSGTFVATWNVQFKAQGESAFTNLGKDYTTQETKTGVSAVRGSYRITMSARTSGAADVKLYT